MKKLAFITCYVFLIFASLIISTDGHEDMKKYLKMNYKNEDIIMSIDFIAGVDGAELKSGQNGYALLYIQNKSNEEIIIPLYYEYYHRNIDLKPNYLSKRRSERDVYKGFEIAKLNCGFIGDGGNDTIINDNRLLPVYILLSPKGNGFLLVSVKAPSKPGTYDFKLYFDNRNLLKAIMSHSFLPSFETEESLFCRDIILKNIEIK